MHQPLYTTSALTLAVPRWKYKFSQPILSICGMLVMRIQQGINKIAVNDFFFILSTCQLKNSGFSSGEVSYSCQLGFQGLNEDFKWFFSGMRVENINIYIHVMVCMLF